LCTCLREFMHMTCTLVRVGLCPRQSTPSSRQPNHPVLTITPTSNSCQLPVSQNEIVSNHDELMCNFFAQADALAYGKSGTELRSQNVPDFLVPHRCGGFGGRAGMRRRCVGWARGERIGRLGWSCLSGCVRPPGALCHAFEGPSGSNGRRGAARLLLFSALAGFGRGGKSNVKEQT
jgi:hypothetical protein